MIDAEFKIGQPVKKVTGYKFPGVVASVFRTRRGFIRYVVEVTHPNFEGMLHIFNGGQLEADEDARVLFDLGEIRISNPPRRDSSPRLIDEEDDGA